MAQAAVRRNLPGTRAEDFCAWEPQPLADMTSTLAAQQYLQQELARRPNAVQALLEVPPHTELAVWQYEHLRQIVLQTHHLIGLMGDGTCTAASCPEMAADNAKFLCSAHAQPSECCAMDYMCHTVDKLTTFVTGSFPSRLDVTPKLAAQFPSAVRRLYRVFLHAYHAHRGEYEQFEAATSLCRRVSCYALKFGFLEADALTIPFAKDDPAPEAAFEDHDEWQEEEGEEEEEEGQEEEEEEEGTSE